jgi:hypothetical protein
MRHMSAISITLDDYPEWDDDSDFSFFEFHEIVLSED